MVAVGVFYHYGAAFFCILDTVGRQSSVLVSGVFLFICDSPNGLEVVPISICERCCGGGYLFNGYGVVAPNVCATKLDGIDFSFYLFELAFALFNRIESKGV